MRKAKIMVVEDEAIVAADIRDCLTARGYEVAAVVASGEEARQQADKLRPSLVLMDIRLSGAVDGIEAADHIRSRFDIPVVFLTAHADETTLQRAKLTEPFGYVLKPFNERELHTAIEIALYRHATETRIKEVEAWMTAVLQSIGDAVITTDRWGLITSMNPAATRLTGATTSEAFNQALNDIFPLLDAATRLPVEPPVGKVVHDGAVVDSPAPLLLLTREGAELPVDYTAAPIRSDTDKITGIVWVFRNMRARREAEAERERLIGELQNALTSVKTLSGLLPVCANCKKIRDDKGYWQLVESYLEAHSDARITHGCCPDCFKKLYPDSAQGQVA